MSVLSGVALCYLLVEPTFWNFFRVADDVCFQEGDLCAFLVVISSPEIFNNWEIVMLPIL